jgi:hypothetical protein
MGGVQKVFDKVRGKDSKPAAASLADKLKSSQSTAEAGYEDSEDRQRKKNKRQGKRKLQIPTSATGASAPGGTGLGTGV